MTNIDLLRRSALCSASFIGLGFVMAAPAYAQGTPQQSTTPSTVQPGQELPGDPQQEPGQSEQEIESATTANDQDSIVVTGSRIRRPNLESQVPVTSIGGEEFFQQGQTNVGDTLNELPQLRSTFAQQNPGLGIGIAGLNLLDLRGLGTQRTLVLVNGRRHVAADILNNAVSPDVNTIPNDLIERVDVVTGGNSAIYGSDAIAGVVNFVLRRDFEGLQIRGSGAVSEEGFGGNQYISAMAGMNFGGGRGNITAHMEYAHQDRIFGSDIAAFRQNNNFGVVDVDPAGLPNGSDGFPDRVFVRDIRSASINRFGLVPVTQRNGTSLCGNGIASTDGPPATGASSNPYNCTFIFTPEGRLVPQTGTRFGSGIIGGILGGNGQTGREDQLLSVLPEIDRYNFNLLGHYTFTEALEAFFEAKFVRVDALGSNAGPSFIQGVQNQFDFRERIRLDNPFLNPADRATLAAAILASGCNTSLTVACPAAGNLTAAQQTAIANGSFRFALGRQLADSGIRDEDFQRDTYRVVVGLRGTFNEDWSYELSANYGKFEENTTTFGYLDRQRFMLALDAGRNPTTGQIQCRSQFDPASAVAFTAPGVPGTFAGNQARLAADIAACVPYNPIGGADNSASANYFVYNARHRAASDQLVFSGFVSGDSSQLFELPGGPVRFAVGAEYRREESLYVQDPFVEQGFTNAVAIPTFAPPAFEVKEAYGEIQLPLLRDMPFFEDLTLSGAARVADYEGGTGRVEAYNAGLEWAPIRDVRFRANYGRSVRAPNVSETGFPVVPNFAPNFQDPCQPNQIGTGSGSRAANCAAALGGLLGNLQNRVYSLPILSGSNVDLQAETSDSYTLGVVIQPRFVPGLSLTIDYFDITVSEVIVSLAAQAIANGCYDQPTLANPFCASFTRFTGPGTGPLGEVPGDILGNSLLSAPLNFAKRQRRGIDFEAAYRTDLGSDSRLNTRLIYTHQLQNSNFQNPSLPDFENRLLGELGDPQDEFRWNVDLTFGAFTLGYEMRYIGPQVLNLYEDFFALDTACSTTCPPNDADYADVREYPAVVYHDLRFDFDVGNQPGLKFFFGIDNLTDVDPPFGLTATGAGPSGNGNAAIYSVRGRNYYAGFRARF